MWKNPTTTLLILVVIGASAAAQDTVAQINFQPGGAAAPAGWTADTGVVFDATLGHGWDDEVRTKEREFNPDVLLDTYAYVSNSDVATWEYALANGTYLVTLVAGSPRWSGQHTVVVEGDLVLDAVETRRDFVEVTDHEVSVRDGRLSVTIGNGPGRKTKICYLVIRTSDGSAPPPPPDTTTNNPPRVTASADVTEGDAPLAVAFSGTAEDDEGTTTASWAFGDGANDAQLDTSRTYDTPGVYEAVLTVTDEGGLTVEASIFITVNEPPPPPPDTSGDMQINFQPADASVPAGHLADAGEPFDATRGYGWDDDVSTRERDRNDDHRLDTYAYVSNNSSATWEFALANGDYEVTLVAGSPRFSGRHTVVLEGTTVIDDVATSGAEFVEATRRPVTVADGRLTVRIGGSNVSRKTKLCYLIVHGTNLTPTPGYPPTASASATPTSGVAPLDVAFTGGGSDPDGSAVSFSWDFGDGSLSTEQSPQHSYQAPGTFTARLTVTDADGRTAVAEVAISVSSGVPLPSGAVTASVETDPVLVTGDAADDLAIWLHPTDRSLSVIVGTDKSSRNLIGYDLGGNELWRVSVPGSCNNVDVRGDVVVCSVRYDESIGVFLMDPDTRTLTEIGLIDVGFSTYGLTLYESPASGRLYAFVSGSGSDIEQWEIELSPLTGKLVRELDTAKVEGMVADDESGLLFAAEENVGLYVYDAEPTGGSARTRIGSISGDSHLDDDLEGLCLYRAAGGEGYLIVSVQGLDNFAVYDREAPHAYLGSFEIVEGVHDGVSDTDGIDVINLDLGSGFPQGVFVAQDGSNRSPGAAQNFKLVPWERIADLLGLVKDATYVPE